MGCDIHLYVERKNTEGNWELLKGKNPMISFYEDLLSDCNDDNRKEQYKKEIESYTKKEPKTYEGWAYDGRNYRLFSILADVRNGISAWRDEPATGHYIKPISEPKGMPNDMSDKMREEYDYGYEHSGSYLTLKELLEYDWNSPIKYRALVGKEEYKKFKEIGHPESWCGGSSALLITNEQMEKYINGEITFDKDFIHTVIEWEESAIESVEYFYKNTIEELKKLGKPEDVRIVFWFDS